MKYCYKYLFNFLVLIILYSCNTSEEKNINQNKEKNSGQVKIDNSKETKDSNSQLPNKILELIPNGYGVLVSNSGNLNLDNIDDYILVINRVDEKTAEENRIVLILIGQSNGSFKLVKKNDKLVYYSGMDFCSSCGDKIFEIVVSTTIKNGYFSIEQNGITEDLIWYRITTFKFSKQENNWYLHRDGVDVSIKSDSLEFTPNTFNKTTNDFGQILFENYNIKNEQLEK